jgi:hypothetical protein
MAKSRVPDRNKNMQAVDKCALKRQTDKQRGVRYLTTPVIAPTRGSLSCTLEMLIFLYSKVKLMLEVSGQLHAPASLPPGKEPRYPLDMRLDGP